MNLHVMEHIARSDDAVSDYIARARAAGVHGPSPAPGDRTANYAEAHRAADLLGHSWQNYLEAREWQTRVETLILTGDTTPIRREPCPACRTWGLVWVRQLQRASCINRHCASGNQGAARVWSIAQLSRHAVARTPVRAVR